MPGGFFTGKSKDYKGNDDFYTLKETWELIVKYLPTNKIAWEAFWGNGKSGQFLTELGVNVIHKDEDFFEFNRGDYVLSNLPFSIKRKILDRLYELEKPFILIMPYEVIFYQYFNKFKTSELTILIPPKRQHFNKPDGTLKKFNYDCVFFAWKMNLESQLIFLK